MNPEKKYCQVMVKTHPVPAMLEHNVFGDYDTLLSIYVRKYPDDAGEIGSVVHLLVSLEDKTTPAILTEKQVDGIARSLMTRNAGEFTENFELPEKIELS